MKRLFYLIYLISVTSFAQREEIENRLSEYGISTDFLEHSIRNADKNFTFKYKMTTGSSDGTPIVNEVDYDPRRKTKERWKLNSVNGNSPTKKEIKAFNRINNPRRKEVFAELDHNSYTIIVDNDQYFTYSFKYKPGTITNNRKFLEDCIGYVYLDKKIGNISGVRYENEVETTVKMFKCKRFVADYELKYDSNSKMYLITGEEFDMTLMIFGKEAEIDQIGEYYDYQFIE